MSNTVTVTCQPDETSEHSVAFRYRVAFDVETHELPIEDFEVSSWTAAHLRSALGEMLYGGEDFVATEGCITVESRNDVVGVAIGLIVDRALPEYVAQDLLCALEDPWLEPRSEQEKR